MDVALLDGFELLCQIQILRNTSKLYLHRIPTLLCFQKDGDLLHSYAIISDTPAGGSTKELSSDRQPPPAHSTTSTRTGQPAGFC